MARVDRFKEYLNRNKLERFNRLAVIDDLLMSEYGWIPTEELEKLPLTRGFNLVQIILARREEEKKESNKIKSRRR